MPAYMFMFFTTIAIVFIITYSSPDFVIAYPKNLRQRV